MLSEGAEALTHAGTAIYTTSTGVLYLPFIVCRCKTCEPGIVTQLVTMSYCSTPSRIFSDETPDVVNDYGIYLAGAGLGAVGISYLLGGQRKDGGMNPNNGFLLSKLLVELRFVVFVRSDKEPLPIVGSAPAPRARRGRAPSNAATTPTPRKRGRPSTGIATCTPSCRSRIRVLTAVVAARKRPPFPSLCVRVYSWCGVCVVSP
jgi:hypothetical protein